MKQLQDLCLCPEMSVSQLDTEGTDKYQFTKITSFGETSAHVFICEAQELMQCFCVSLADLVSPDSPPTHTHKNSHTSFCVLLPFPSQDSPAVTKRTPPTLSCRNASLLIVSASIITKMCQLKFYMLYPHHQISQKFSIIT